MINNPVVFYIASFLIISFALCSMFLKNIIYSLLCAVMVFFSASIFFYMLGSEYNAIIQAAIYGFAVPVIIGISVMFTTGKYDDKNSSKLPLIFMLVTILFLLLFTDLVIIANIKMPNTFNLMQIQQFNSYDVLSEFARGIFIDYVWAFELLSLLLTTVIAGLTLFNGKGSGIRSKLKWK